MKRVKAGVSAIIVTLLMSGPGWAAGDRMDELERRITILSEELDGLKASGGGSGAMFGEKTTIGGYGELHYNETPGKTKTLDLHRVILFVSHSFNDWIKFNSELEVEHTFVQDGDGELSYEQAYLDFLVSKYVNVRAGLVLIPVGITNETHEPPTFHGVERPEVDKYIIPTTWRENGAGLFGEIVSGLQYKLYVTNGGDISTWSSSSQGFRKTRQKGFNAKANDLAYTLRLEYSGVPGLKVGGSYYTGDSSQDVDAYGNATISLWDLDARFAMQGFEFKGLYASGSISDTDKINTVSDSVIGSALNGYYAEFAYNALALVRSDHYLAPFVRYEQFDTHAGVASGYTRDDANNRTTITYGLTYKPVHNVAVKVDYQSKSNAKDGVKEKLEDAFNIGVGYMF